MSKTVLVVEDEAKIAEVLRDYLEHAGYSVRLHATGAGVAELVTAYMPALVLLDIMLPEVDGLTALKEIRNLPAQQGDVPVLMLTARVEEIDRLLGLEMGADDYICKPFSPREVVARVKAVLRRASKAEPVDATHGVELDSDRLLLSYAEHSVALTRVETEMLAPMLNNPGRIFSREQLMQHAYDDHRVVSDRTIDSHIVKLRKKFSRVAPVGTGIESVYGVGYRFVAD